VRKSFAALAQLSPARYGKIELAQVWLAALQVPVPAASAEDPPAAAVASSSGAHATVPPQAAKAAAPSAPSPSPAALADFQQLTALANAGRDTDAQLELEQFELRYPGYPTAAIDLGLLARRDGQLPQSETALRRATQLDPANPMAWSELGITLRQEGKFKDARAAYMQALAVDPNYAPAHRNLGVLLDLYQGDPTDALSEFQRYKQLTGEDKPVSVWLADLRRRSGTHAAAASPAAVAPPSPIIAAPVTGKAGST
jgi:Flp pilus assembly protein TadD